jgi:hypothetical protein
MASWMQNLRVGEGRCFLPWLLFYKALAEWMFHGRAYAGGRFVFLLRFAYSGTP